MGNSNRSTLDITAEMLRKITDQVEVNIEPILLRCHEAAKAGENYYIHCDHLTVKQLNELISRAFIVNTLEFEKYKIEW